MAEITGLDYFLPSEQGNIYLPACCVKLLFFAIFSFISFIDDWTSALLNMKRKTLINELCNVLLLFFILESNSCEDSKNWKILIVNPLLANVLSSRHFESVNRPVFLKSQWTHELTWLLLYFVINTMNDFATIYWLELKPTLANNVSSIFFFNIFFYKLINFFSFLFFLTMFYSCTYRWSCYLFDRWNLIFIGTCTINVTIQWN